MSSSNNTQTRTLNCDNEQVVESAEIINTNYLLDLDNVSSEDDDYEPISGIVKRMMENNKTPDKLLDSLSEINQQ